MARKYLFRRPGSQNVWIRFQYPKGSGFKTHAQSLGTANMREAEILALPLIQEHKLNLLEAQNRHGVMIAGRRTRRVKVAGFKWLYPLGDTTNDDGTRTVATEKTVLILKDGQVIREADNDLRIVPTFRFDPKPDKDQRPSKPDLDDAVLSAWVAHRKLGKSVESDARQAMKLFRTICQKPLTACTRVDGKKLVTLLEESGNKDKTVAKKIGYLSAAVNLAIDDEHLTVNPFSKVIPKITDETERLPLSDEDMALVREHLQELRAEDQLLWNWLARTGMRLDEPFQITEEHREAGIRFVIVGSKTASSKRRIPIPTAMLALLPAKITGSLFTDRSDVAGKWLRHFLRRLGIMHDSEKGTGDKRKVLHGLRHRAKDRLRAVACPLDLQYELLGHEEQTVAASYGRGSPLPVLREWV